jgi:hypothetical protein
MTTKNEPSHTEKAIQNHEKVTANLAGKLTAAGCGPELAQTIAKSEISFSTFLKSPHATIEGTEFEAAHTRALAREDVRRSIFANKATDGKAGDTKLETLSERELFGEHFKDYTPNHWQKGVYTGPPRGSK